MDAILKKLNEMRNESSTLISSLIEDLLDKIEVSRTDIERQFQTILNNLTQENSQLKESIGSLEARVSVFKTSSSASTETVREFSCSAQGDRLCLNQCC